MPMIRKQVYLDRRHDRMLKRRARQRGVTEAEVIREILDRSEAGAGPTMRQKPDPEAGRKLLASLRSLSKQSRPRSGARRSWDRESLYEDRIGRWTKS